MPAIICKTAEPDLPPGVRMVAGRPYIFDLDALKAHEAEQRIVAAMGAGLSAATADDLDGLVYALITCRHRVHTDAEWSAFADRVHAERAARRTVKARAA